MPTLYEIKLQMMYPRLDINVSKDVHHLLKSPFSIHPKTGNVCVPFDNFDTFSPFTDVPKLDVIVKQLNSSSKSGAVSTDLDKYCKIFEKFVESCCLEEDKHVEEFYKINGPCSPQKKIKMEMLSEDKTNVMA